MSELETNDRVVYQFLAKCATLVCVLYTFLVADTGETETLDNYTNSLMVEVCHDDYGIISRFSKTALRRNIPLNPWFSFPIRFSTGTFTSSNVTYVVPLDQTP